MSRIKSQLRYGLWPDSRASTHHQPSELTAAAKAQGEQAIETLDRLGVDVTLDKLGRAHFRFRGRAAMPVAARSLIERTGDLIELVLIERQRQPAALMNLTGAKAAAGLNRRTPP